MNKTFYLISALTFTLVINSFSQKQTIELNFTAQYQAQYVMLDSIYVENLTQGGDTMLYAPDTVLVLDFVTGVLVNPALNEGFRVSQNSPNPFTEKTSINIFLPKAYYLQVSVVNLLGQKVAFFENSMDGGNHSFVFYPGDDRYYILTATASGLTKTIKMVSLNNYTGKYCSLSYVGAVETPDEYKSIQETNDFGYALGDQLLFICYAQNPSNIIGSDVFEVTPTGNEEYIFDIIEGIPCQSSPTITYEGQIYTTLKIGDQCWLKENLNVGTMIQGTQLMTNNGIIEKYCYNSNIQYCAAYGGLYRWSEMMQYFTQPGTQGICPPGWHVPTDQELCTLTQFIDPTVDCNGIGWTGTDVGTKMKSTAGWYSNGNGTNESGFTAISSGFYSSYVFHHSGTDGYFWSSNEGSNDESWRWWLAYDFANIDHRTEPKSVGFSVRCLQNESAPIIPTVTSADITDVTQITATSGGEVIDEGGTYVTARGVCWSTSPNPTIANSHTSDGNGIGIFVSDITGLDINTIYFVRAYATNAIGTAYGNELSFTTLPFSTCGDLISYEGQNYNTVQIGTQCWLKENLNVGTMIMTSQSMSNNGIIEKYCCYNIPDYCVTYGGLYQWNETMQYTTQQGTQGICPSGWHIPTEGEWCTLTQFIDQTVDCNSIGHSGTDVGTKMKSTTGWSSGGGGTNESGFTALPGGFIIPPISQGMLSEAFFWNSTETNTTKSWFRKLSYDYDNIFRNESNKYLGKR